MKNILRVAAVVLPLLGSATIAMAQASPDFNAVTGSENSIRDVTGQPQLRDDGGFARDQQHFDRGWQGPYRTYVR